MDIKNIEYKNIGTSVRTPKVVTFISNKDLYWRHTISRIIEWYSKMWGGAYNLIIPTDGKTIDEKYWKLLERYSPDYLFSYYYVFAGLSLADPKKYERGIKNRHDQLKKGFSDMSEESIVEHINQEAQASIHHKFEFSKELEQELMQRLSPFYFQEHVVKEKVTWNSKVSFPLTAIEKIIPNTEVRNIFSVDLSKKYNDMNLKLLVYSVSGFATNEYLKELEKLDITIDHMPDNYPLKSILDDVIKGGVDLRSQKLEKELSETLKTKKKAEWIPEYDYLSQSPFSLSLLKLGKYHKITEHKDWEEPVVLVIGDTVEDFCYYYSLSKAHGDFYWIPRSFLNRFERALAKKEKTKKYLTELEAIPYAIINILYGKIGYGYDDKKILLASMSLGDKELTRLKNLLSKASINPDIAKSIEIVSNQDLTKCILSVIEQDNYTNQQTQAFIDGQSVGRIETPKPKNFKYIDPREHRWITELTIDGYKLPQLHFLGHQVISLSDAHDVRVSGEGISYLCPSLGYFGGEIDSILVKPKMRLVDPITIFRDYYQEAGYKKIAISDKGQLTKRAIDKFGSLEEIGYFILPEQNRKLIEKFLNAPQIEDKETGEEIVFVNQRNYLNFKAIEITLGSEKAARQLVDELTIKNILHRGFIFHCEACLKSDWYSITEVTKTFTCSRCSHNQIYERSHWKSPNEPSWYYKLDEVIREGFKQNMSVPIMTLFQLKKKSKESFLFSHEISLWKIDPSNGKPDLEIDLNCIVDGKIVIGESKVDTVTLSEINKYSSFIKTLKKHPDRVVFSTFNDSWSEKVKEGIDKIDKSEIIFNRDLLSIQ